ncbi:hypothetical protein V4287_002652 [Serratia marcescens]|uniref:hypothetical protein n=1 Tax=Serratia TaxID=613 RepID=UPI000B61B8BC|nr:MULTISPECIES: hypothetical protein [Serratia]ASM15409.1 hypothetical protein BVG90_01220 [Serratia marcescens]EIY4263089.1 hypothetical protein [Serratia marcescens]MBH2789662.1 hypothetical protein [Serratia marcescens]MBH2851946.1 hypothetical protein [Serratia marcescens]MBH2908939.1 hypothetical protein [Serratia marcescens]
MKKFLLALNLLLFFLFFSFSMSAAEPFKCTSHYKTHIEKDNNFTLFDGRITLFLKNKHEGFFSLLGKVKTDNNSYLLSRTAYFTLAPQKINHVNQANIVKVNKHPSDLTPEDIWLADILPELPGIDFQIEIWRLKDNLILVKSLNTGYLICAAEH